MRLRLIKPTKPFRLKKDAEKKGGSREPPFFYWSVFPLLASRLKREAPLFNSPPLLIGRIKSRTGC